MIDLRFHALSLIAVFLALAIGLMMGSALGSPERTSSMYTRLRQEFDQLREVDRKLNDDLQLSRRRADAGDQALRELAPLAARDRLAGSTIGVILCQPVDESRFWPDLESVVKAAGGELGAVARVPDHLRPMDPAQRSRFHATWPPEAGGDGSGEYEPAAWLVRCFAGGAPAERLRELSAATGIEVRGDMSAPVRRLLLITAVADEEREDRVRAGDLPELRIAAQAATSGVRLVAAEPSDVLSSALEPLRRKGVPTVDTIDTAQGQIAAVLALAGADGSFGFRPGAERALPPLQSP
jgi:hypothetical protein